MTDRPCVATPWREYHARINSANQHAVTGTSLMFVCLLLLVWFRLPTMDDADGVASCNLRGATMAYADHVAVVKQGADAIQKWRFVNPDERLDLSRPTLGIQKRSVTRGRRKSLSNDVRLCAIGTIGPNALPGPKHHKDCGQHANNDGISVTQNGS